MNRGYCFGLVASRLRSNDYIDWLLRSLGDSKRILGDPIGVIDDTNVSTAVTKLQGCAGVVLLVATGGTEHILLELRRHVDKPMLVIAIPYANSLPAVMEAAPVLRRHGKASIHYMPGFDSSSIASLETALRGLQAASKIHGARLGVIGGISPWLVYSRLSQEKARSIGVDLVEIGLGEFKEIYEAIEPPSDLVERVVKGATRLHVGLENIRAALGVYTALKEIIHRYRLNALTIKCFDLIFELKTTACLALSLLNSEGFTAGCEGDVPSTLAMMMLSGVSGKPAFMANPARIEEDSVLFAHCTSPISHGPYELMTHFESGIGVGVSVKFPVGVPVTIARLDPESLKLRVLTGVVKASGWLSEKHCRTQILVKTSAARRLLDDSIGNHYVIVPGRYVDELRHTANLLGLGFEELGPAR